MILRSPGLLRHRRDGRYDPILAPPLPPGRRPRSPEQHERCPVSHEIHLIPGSPPSPVRFEAREPDADGEVPWVFLAFCA